VKSASPSVALHVQNVIQILVFVVGIFFVAKKGKISDRALYRMFSFATEGSSEPTPIGNSDAYDSYFEPLHGPF
jgi:hypothetical protein